MVELFRQTGTFWEYLAPDKVAPGASVVATNPGTGARRAFTGFGTHPPIAYLLEYAIGLRPDALRNHLVWDLTTTDACGCANYSFGGGVTDLLVERRSSLDEPPRLSVKTNAPYRLTIRFGDTGEKAMERDVQPPER